MIPGLRERWVGGGNHKGGSRMVAFTLFYGITRRSSQSQLKRKVLEETSWWNMAGRIGILAENRFKFSHKLPLKGVDWREELASMAWYWAPGGWEQPTPIHTEANHGCAHTCWLWLHQWWGSFSSSLLVRLTDCSENDMSFLTLI